MRGAVLGIESTAHTFSLGWVDEEGVIHPSISSAVRPDEGGIHPREAAESHRKSVRQLVKEYVDHPQRPAKVAAVAFSQGPGMGPCLRIGASVARSMAALWDVPLIGVNHCVAHIEVGRTMCNMDDPLLLYVSGGNTQVITRVDGRYRVMGETSAESDGSCGSGDGGEGASTRSRNQEDDKHLEEKTDARTLDLVLSHKQKAIEARQAGDTKLEMEHMDLK